MSEVQERMQMLAGQENTLVFPKFDQEDAVAIGSIYWRNFCIFR